MDNCKKPKNNKKVEKPKINIFDFAQIIGNYQKLITVN